MGKAINIMGAFFPEYYRKLNPDVANDPGYGQNDATLARHWIEHGIHEFRSPSPFFKPNFYRENNPDLRDFDGKKLFEHWVSNGINELRAGTEYFSLGYYFNAYTDLQAALGPDAEKLFEHWLYYGNGEARKTSPQRILRIAAENQDGSLLTNNNNTVAIISGEGEEAKDPDLFKPFNTTGGQIGFATGILIGLYFGGIEGAVEGGVVGALAGHALDRLSTRIANDITGPAWRDLEGTWHNIEDGWHSFWHHL